MRKLLLLIVLAGCGTIVSGKDYGSITARITDKETAQPIQGATAMIKGDMRSAISNADGLVRFQNIRTGPITLLISHIGFAPVEISVLVNAGKDSRADVALETSIGGMDNVVVSASRRLEKITYAPAAINMISTKDLEQFAGSNPLELMAYIQGVEYTRTGVDVVNINARGFNSAFNNKVLHLVDGRNSMNNGSGGLPLFNNGTSVKEDIERVEVILGPQSALYGPNAHNGLINVITKDPRRFPGTTVAIAGGTQYQFSSRFRHAAKINKRIAFKISGEYATGRDFEWYDSVYAGGGSNGPAVVIPERNVDFNFRHIRGEGHVYYSITPVADIVVSGGASDNNWLQTQTGGRNQMKGTQYSFLQARITHRRFFATVYNSWGTIGNGHSLQSYTREFWNSTHRPVSPLTPEAAEIYALRYPIRFKDRNQRLNAEAQYNYNFAKQGVLFIAGVSYQKDKPYSFGVSLGDSVERIYVTQYGGVLQLQKSFPWSLRFIAAIRFDHHSKLGNYVSPRVAVLKPVSTGSIRLTWGTAYAMPSILTQSYNNGGLFGNGEGITYIPNLSRFSDSVRVLIPRLKAEGVSTWEIGYRSNIGKKLFVDANYYNGSSKNFLSPSLPVGGRILKMGDRYVQSTTPGAVQNDTLKNASFSSYFNYGNVRVWGVDVAMTYSFSKIINLGLKYAWFNSDLRKTDLKNDANRDGVLSIEEQSLNTPRHRGAAILSFEHLLKQEAFVKLAMRFVEKYNFFSGAQIGTEEGEGSRGFVPRPGLPPLIKNYNWGPLGGFATVDMQAGLKMTKAISLAVNVTNVFNTRQREFVGSPLIGRLISAELKVMN